MNISTAVSNKNELAVSLHDVSKSYKFFQLKKIDLEIQRGTVVGLIGPNGAGKSTIMRILMGLVAPEQGVVSVLGSQISSRDAAVKQSLGYFADDMRLYKAETILWHMQFVRSMFPTWDQRYADELLNRFGLIGAQKVKGLSHGQRVKAMLMLILARQPELLILDEPTNGLDPVAKQEVTTELMRVIEDEERTILYSSHNTRDIEQICDSIVFIDRGQIIAANDRDEFMDAWRRIKIQVHEDWQLPNLPSLKQDSLYRSLRVLSTDQYSEEMSNILIDSGAKIESIERMTLEEIFVGSVTRGREQAS